MIFRKIIEVRGARRKACVPSLCPRAKFADPVAGCDFAQPLTARNVQFYGREDMKVQNTLRELCAELRVSRRAVQGYEKWGLLAPTGRNKYGHLLYDQNAKERVKTIRFYQRAGFALKENQRITGRPQGSAESGVPGSDAPTGGGASGTRTAD